MPFARRETRGEFHRAGDESYSRSKRLRLLKSRMANTTHRAPRHEAWVSVSSVSRCVVIAVSRFCIWPSNSSARAG
jgi:hypothetical protein